MSASSHSVWESEADLAVSPNGEHVLAVWTGRTTADEWISEGPIGFAFSSDRGDTWQMPGTLVSPDHETPYNVRATADVNGNFWAVWLARSSFNQDAIVVASAPDGSFAFQQPVEVTDRDPGYWLDLPSIVVHRGVVMAAYAYDEDCLATEVARSEDGITWERVTAAPCVAEAQVRNLNALCAGDTSDWVWLVNAWGMPPTQKFVVELRGSTDGGRTWPNLVVLSEPDEDVSFEPIRCVAAREQVWVVYTRANGDVVPGQFSMTETIRVVRADRSGVIERFNARDSQAGLGMHPQLARDASGGINIVNHEGVGDNDPAGTIRWTRLAPGGMTFERSTVIDGPIVFDKDWGVPDFLGDYFGLAVAGDTLFAAYAFMTGEDPHVVFKRWGATP